MFAFLLMHKHCESILISVALVMKKDMSKHFWQMFKIKKIQNLYEYMEKTLSNIELKQFVNLPLSI